MTLLAPKVPEMRIVKIVRHLSNYFPKEQVNSNPQRQLTMTTALLTTHREHTCEWASPRTTRRMVNPHAERPTAGSSLPSRFACVAGTNDQHTKTMKMTCAQILRKALSTVAEDCRRRIPSIPTDEASLAVTHLGRAAAGPLDSAALHRAAFNSKTTFPPNTRSDAKALALVAGSRVGRAQQQPHKPKIVYET